VTSLPIELHPTSSSLYVAGSHLWDGYSKVDMRLPDDRRTVSHFVIFAGCDPDYVQQRNFDAELLNLRPIEAGENTFIDCCLTNSDELALNDHRRRHEWNLPPNLPPVICPRFTARRRLVIDSNKVIRLSRGARLLANIH
jgi:hypothetical protein